MQKQLPLLKVNLKAPLTKHQKANISNRKTLYISLV